MNVASPFAPGTLVAGFASSGFVPTMGTVAGDGWSQVKTFISLGNPDMPLTGWAQRSDSEGSPGTPCLDLARYGAYRFRWAIIPGARTISVRVKQPGNLVGYPTLVIKACAAVGLAADVVGMSAGGTGWVTIGPIGFSATGSGSVWVELHNNTSRTKPTDVVNCFFDHLVAT